MGQLVNASRGLARNIAGDISTLPTTARARAAIDLDIYDEPNWGVDSSNTMRNVGDGWQPDPPGMHNRVHVWIGGDMAPASSPNDPVFFLNHCNVDRLWTAWQQKHPNIPYLPGSNAAASLKFHRLSDKLFSVFSNAPKVSDLPDVADVYAYDTVADVL
jgi:tyrosinase